MKRTFRKQTRDDFIRRIERLDPDYARQSPEARDDRKPWEMDKLPRLKRDTPVKMTLLGFGLAVAAFLGVEDPGLVQSLLLQSGWPAEFLSHAMNGAAFVLLFLVVALVGNIVRIFNPRATGRGNARGLVAGAFMAFGVLSIPEAYIQDGFELAGFENATHAFSFAQEKSLQLANIDWGSVVMVSSATR